MLRLSAGTSPTYLVIGSVTRSFPSSWSRRIAGAGELLRDRADVEDRLWGDRRRARRVGPTISGCQDDSIILGNEDAAADAGGGEVGVDARGDRGESSAGRDPGSIEVGRGALGGDAVRARRRSGARARAPRRPTKRGVRGSSFRVERSRGIRAPRVPRDSIHPCPNPHSSSACPRPSASSARFASGSIRWRGSACRRTSPYCFHSWRAERIDAAALERARAAMVGIGAFRFRLGAIGRFPETLCLAPEPAAPIHCAHRGARARVPGPPALSRRIPNYSSAPHGGARRRRGARGGGGGAAAIVGEWGRGGGDVWGSGVDRELDGAVE